MLESPRAAWRGLLIAALALLPWAVGAAEVRALPVARCLVQPEAVAPLPDGRFLVNERAGRMRLVGPDGRVGEPLQGLPAVDAGGQCGLLDVVADPRFAKNRFVYWTYAEAGEGGNTAAVARGRLRERLLAEVQVIFRQQPRVASQLHCSSRLAFGCDGRLFVALGNRFSRKDDAQELANHPGKIVRIEPDRRVPTDNPFVVRAGARPELWGLGHRNVQGMAVHLASGELWATEHGPQGGEEVNVVDGGRNFGWPLRTYGRNYGLGTRIGEEGPRAGLEQPLKWWVPVSVAPSGLAFVTSERYPAWRGSLLMGALRGQALIRLSLDGRRVIGEELLLTRLNARIRDVGQGLDGWIYVLTEGADGQLLRLQP